MADTMQNQGSTPSTAEGKGITAGSSRAGSSIEDLAQVAVDLAMQRGADYADARIVRLARETLTVHNGAVADAEAPDEFGVGLRVLKDGAFGFAAAPTTYGGLGDVLPGLARRALALARDLAPLRRRPIQMSGEATARGEYATPVVENPFLVPLEEKVDLLLRADRGMSGRREIVSRLASIGIQREEQWQVTSEGGATHQVLMRAGGRIEAIASAGGVVERRSYPNALEGDFRGGGFEVIRSSQLDVHAERVRDEAIALCHADVCPGGKRTLILGGSQLALQIHESVGHPTELDRILGEERDLAGGSFAGLGDLGGLQYGSKHVSFVADSTAKGGLDTRGWDDDGVASRRFEVVREGRFVGVMGGRASSGRAGISESGSVSRAEGWYSPPIDRITNLSLVPGSGSLEDLIASSEDGTIFADTVKTWSIDQERRNFQFTCEVAWEIRGGRRSRLLRLPTYQGNSVAFWNSCDAVAGPQEWRLYGVVNCGKGNPMQIAEMSHGAAPARFRGVQMLDMSGGTSV
ncbi:protease TldD [Planctomycetes bacterium Poly30]|uniref:Protease TldD n=1 Tax=Saltatorellus ferox TaxID=2528018 RepID=A0A518ETM4_9BACT|nr:protease TldD [Planctomycetes bacterium Poly30]